MKRAVLLLAMLASACLGRELVGELPDAGCSGQACSEGDGAAASREEQITRLLRALAGRWEGSATSGIYEVAITIEFSADGHYTLRCPDPAEERDCGVLFWARQGEVQGTYTIDDVLHGEFFGTFHDPEAVLTPRSDLSYLTLAGDKLRLERRTLVLNLAERVVLLVLDRAT